MSPSIENTSWTVYRQDDTGNQFVVQSDLTRDAAEALVREFEARGHKQHYWAATENPVQTDNTSTRHHATHQSFGFHTHQ